MLRSLAIAFALSSVSLPASADTLGYMLKQRAQQAHSTTELGKMYRVTSRNEGSRAQVRQEGDNLSAVVHQSGKGHRVLIDQQGSGHSVDIAQTGRGNVFAVTQRGHGATANIHQNGTRQFGYVFQYSGKNGSLYEYRW